MATQTACLAYFVAVLACTQWWWCVAECSGNGKEPIPSFSTLGVDITMIALLVVAGPLLIIFLWKLDAMASRLSFVMSAEEIMDEEKGLPIKGTMPIQVPEGIPILSPTNVELVSNYSASNSGLVLLCNCTFNGAKRPCLLKTLSGVEPEKLERLTAIFNKELRALSGLNHPNLLTLLGAVNPDVVFSEPPPSQLLEYPKVGRMNKYLRDSTMGTVAKAPLDTNPDSNGSVTPTTLVRFAHDLCSAVDYLHSRNIVHKDITGHNCFIEEDFTLKLSLYELFIKSFEWEYKGPKGFRTFQGACRWMSPEMLDGTKAVSPSSDIWMLAVTLWEIFSKGQKPYSALTLEEVEVKIKAGEHLERPEYCPEDVFALMKRCWSEEVDQRPQAEELKAIFARMMPKSCAGLPSATEGDVEVLSPMGNWTKDLGFPGQHRFPEMTADQARHQDESPVGFLAKMKEASGKDIDSFRHSDDQKLITSSSPDGASSADKQSDSPIPDTATTHRTVKAIASVSKSYPNQSAEDQQESRLLLSPGNISRDTGMASENSSVVIEQPSRVRSPESPINSEYQSSAV